MDKNPFRNVPAPSADLAHAVTGIVLVGACGRFLLQLRDDIPDIVNPGRIGMFGGHLEDGEDMETCARRELEEETGLAVATGSLRPLTELRFNDPRRGMLAVGLFLHEGADADHLDITEGQLIALDEEALAANWHRMTPTTAFAVVLARDLRILGSKATA